jgi:hypothetical protein
MKSETSGQITLLNQRVKCVENWLKLCALGWLLTVSLFFFSWTNQSGTPGSQTDTLKVHKLIILDQENRERIVLAAPIPNPMINGKTLKRKTEVTAGIQFKDGNGTERGGIAALADGGFLFGIDDESGKERAHLYYLPTRGSGLFLQTPAGTETVSLVIPPGDDNPKLEIVDSSGRPTIFAPAKK